MFPFIFLICTQFFFISFFKNSELEIFKYSGLKNLEIIKILSLITFFLGLIIVTFFYNLSSNFKNLYFDFKSDFTSDGKYLAVITNNGLWIKDKIDYQLIQLNEIIIDTFISEFDKRYK